MSEIKHHPMGPSRWPMLACCPGYVSKPATADSVAGTLAHEVLNTLLGGGEVKESAGFLDGAAGWAARYILQTAEQSVAERVLHEPSDCFVQSKAPEYFGTADCIFRDRMGDWHVFDFKSMSDGTKNYFPQVVGYAWPLMRDWMRGHAHLYILHGGSRTIDYRFADIQDCRKVVDVVASNYNNPDGPRASNEWCGMCASYATCGAALAEVADVAVATSHTDPGRELTAKDFLDLAGLTDRGTAARLLTIAKRVSKWADAVEERCRELAKDGPIEFGGDVYALSEVKGRAEVVDKEKAFSVSGLTREAFLSCSTLSIDKVADAMAVATGKSKKACRKQFEDAMGEGIVRMPSTWALKRACTQRDGVTCE